VEALRNRAVASSGTPPARVRVCREVTLPGGRERVWSALTEGGQLSAWFGADVQMDPTPGALATFRWGDGWERGAVVEEVDAPRRLAFRWLPFERTPAGRTIVGPAGRVEFELAESEEGTRLSVTEWAPGKWR